MHLGDSHMRQSTAGSSKSGSCNDQVRQQRPRSQYTRLQCENSHMRQSPEDPRPATVQKIQQCLKSLQNQNAVWRQSHEAVRCRIIKIGSCNQLHFSALAKAVTYTDYTAVTQPLMSLRLSCDALNGVHSSKGTYHKGRTSNMRQTPAAQMRT